MRIEDFLPYVPMGMTGVATPDKATQDDITFCTEAFYEKNSAVVLATASRCVICPQSLRERLPAEFMKSRAILYTDNQKLLFAYLAQRFINRPKGISPHAVIGPDVDLGDNYCIEAGAIIQHATLGDNVWIGPGVVIGGQGFGFVTDPDNGTVLKMPQMGRVRIGNNVEIQAGACIARGAMADTVICDDVKIDQLVHISHNVKIGRGSFIIAHAMIAGTVEIGRYCWIAPHTNIRNKVSVGDFSMTGLGAVVVKDVGVNELVVGVPAKKLRDRYPPDDPILRL